MIRKMLCKLGLHDWAYWSPEAITFPLMRWCRHCCKTEINMDAEHPTWFDTESLKGQEIVEALKQESTLQKGLK